MCRSVGSGRTTAAFPGYVHYTDICCDCLKSESVRGEEEFEGAVDERARSSLTLGVSRVLEYPQHHLFPTFSKHTSEVGHDTKQVAIHRSKWQTASRFTHDSAHFLLFVSKLSVRHR